MKIRNALIVFVCLATMVSVALAAELERSELRAKHPWNISIGGGWRDFEGDEVVDDSPFVSFQFEYDLPSRWTFMSVLGYYPKMAGNMRTEWSTGEEINRLREEAGVDNTTAISFSVEGLYHMRTSSENLDPYLVTSVGILRYFDDFANADSLDPNVTTGAGVLYYMSPQWALRVDARVLLSFSGETRASSFLTCGIVYKLRL